MRRVYDSTVAKNSRAAAEKGKDPAQQLKVQIQNIHKAKLDGDRIIYSENDEGEASNMI